MILTIDIGGTNTKFAVFDKEHIVTRGSWKTISNKALIIDKILGISSENYSALCISTGGFWEEGKCVGYETLELTADGTFIEELSMRLKCDVFIDNDAHCALYSEIKEGALKGYNNGAIILLGSSIGCAVMINGKPYRGSTGQAGQLFLMPEFYDGSIYLYDKFANTLKLTEEYGGINMKGNMFKVIENSIKGDEIASILVNRYIKTVALKCWYIYLMYDVRVIAIGGGIAESDFIFDGVIAEVNKLFVNDKTNRQPNIVRTLLGKDCILTGAFLMSKETK